MPTDHATVELNSVWVPGSAVLGSVDQGLAIAQTFVHENRIRQAASACGAARYCLDRSIERARKITLADNQAIQFPVVELMRQVEMLRLFIMKTSWEMDRIVAECQSSEARRGLKLSAASPIRWPCVTSGQIDYAAKLPTEPFKFVHTG